MTHRALLALALGVLAAHALGPAGAAAAGPADAGYRLAGVIETGGDRSVAILELPRGGQVLIHKGSAIDGGTVTELSRRGVRIVFADHVVELMLSRAEGAAERAAHPAAASSSGQLGPASAHQAAQRRVPPPLPTPLTRTVSPAVVRAFIVNGVPEAPSNTDAKQYVDAEIAQQLDLPAHSQVIAVNDQSAGSPDETVSALQQALTNGVAVITLDTPQGQQRVYVMPASPASR